MGPLLSLSIFVLVGLGFVLMNLLIGKVVRPSLPNPDKQATYECGETTIGSSWVQFDLRFYIVALFFLVFDVEVALIYPWAVVYRDWPAIALLAGLPFLGIVIIGYVYEWWSGSLDWVRSTAVTAIKGTQTPEQAAPGGCGPVAVGPRAQMASLARRDPEALEGQAAGRPS